MKFLKSVWEDYKARRRGERRIAPRGAKGRVYTKDSVPEESPNGVKSAKGRATGQLTMKITRANGDVETVVVPATVTQLGDASNG
jgi:hypothetical protein